jgi:hypothetical protein
VRWLITLALAAAVGPAVARASAASASRPTQLTRYGVTFNVPKGWQLTVGRVNGVLDPVTVFTLSTFRLHPTRTSSGICSRALQRAWRPDGAYVQLAEERDGASRKQMLRRVPPRPRHFRLNARGGGGLCTPPNSGEIAFKQGGRAFYIFYGIGRRASPTTRAQARALLDGLGIAPRR